MLINARRLLQIAHAITRGGGIPAAAVYHWRQKSATNRGVLSVDDLGVLRIQPMSRPWNAKSGPILHCEQFRGTPFKMQLSTTVSNWREKRGKFFNLFNTCQLIFKHKLFIKAFKRTFYQKLFYRKSTFVFSIVQSQSYDV